MIDTRLLTRTQLDKATVALAEERTARRRFELRLFLASYLLRTPEAERGEPNSVTLFVDEWLEMESE